MLPQEFARLFHLTGCEQAAMLAQNVCRRQATRGRRIASVSASLRHSSHRRRRRRRSRNRRAKPGRKRWISLSRTDPICERWRLLCACGFRCVNDFKAAPRRSVSDANACENLRALCGRPQARELLREAIALLRQRIALRSPGGIAAQIIAHSGDLCILSRFHSGNAIANDLIDLILRKHTRPIF
jgi:hypothetical protein